MVLVFTNLTCSNIVFYRLIEAMIKGMKGKVLVDDQGEDKEGKQRYTK